MLLSFLTLNIVALVFCITVVVVAVAVLQYYQASHRPKRFPNGPPTAPFIGNLHQLPLSKAFLKFDTFTDF